MAETVLASWNDGSVKDAILDFVSRVTTGRLPVFAGGNVDRAGNRTRLDSGQYEERLEHGLSPTCERAARRARDDAQAMIWNWRMRPGFWPGGTPE